MPPQGPFRDESNMTEDSTANRSAIWPITRSELLATGTAFRKKLMLWCGAWMLAGLYVMYLSWSSHLATRSDPFLSTENRRVDWPIIVIVLVWFILPAVVTFVSIRRQARRWREAAPRVWESAGLTCPWCHEDVRTTPCERHGVGPEHQALLIDHYVAAATGRREQQAALGIAVFGRRSGWDRIRYWRSRQWDLRRIAGDLDRPTEERTRARVILLALPIGMMLILAIAARLAFGVPFISSISFYLILIIVGAVPWLGWNGYLGGMRKERFCTGCDHRCPDLSLDRCPECGLDLHTPHATAYRSVQVRSVHERVVAFGMLGFVLLIPIIFIRLVGVLLPTDMQARVFVWTGTPAGYYHTLELDGMTPEEAKRQADLLLTENATLEHAWSSGTFLSDALGLGLLPESYREAAARATTDANLEVSKDGVEWSATVEPHMKKSLLSPHEPRLGVGQLTIDGRPIEARQPWTLQFSDTFDVPENLRRFSKVPEGRLTFRFPLELESGDHVIEARCWILLPNAAKWEDVNVEYDDTGSPILAPGEHAYELVLTESVTVP